MKQAVLDTNFILTCVRQKIDFFDEIISLGMQIVIPKQVINEIKRISESKKKLRFREDARLALIILNKSKFKEIDLRGKYVDKALIKYSKEKKNIIVATLDRNLKNKIKSNKLVIRERKRIQEI